MKRGLILLVTLLSLSACSAGAQPTQSTSPTPSPTIQACAELNIAAADAVGEGALPQVSAECLQGTETVKLSQLRGPMLIAVWASWCQPCKEELPILQAFSKEFGNEVGVLGYNFLDVTDQAIAASVNWGVDLPSLEDQDGVYRTDIGVTAPPTTLLVDSEGRIIHRHFGAIKDRAELLQLVNSKFGLQLK